MRDIRAGDLVGAVLMERYLLEYCVARGGMASVYRARDERLMREVCVKVFMGWNPSVPAYETVLQHFVQEAFVLSRLSHPNTVRIYDFGYLDLEPHSPYYVSEFLNEGTLRAYVHAHKGLSPRETLEIVEPVCGALAEAHDHGLVHRDIKPNNILFGRIGDQRIVKLADFGIAKIYEPDGNNIPNRAEDTSVVANGIHMYSASWCAPEQLVGDVAGPPTDVYALGLLTAFTLSGEKVFRSSLAKCIRSRLEGNDFFDREIGRLALPASLLRVIRNACRTAIDERYATTHEFLADLQQAVEEARDERSSRTESSSPLQRRRRLYTPTIGSSVQTRGSSSTLPSHAERAHEDRLTRNSAETSPPHSREPFSQPLSVPPTGAASQDDKPIALLSNLAPEALIEERFSLRPIVAQPSADIDGHLKSASETITTRIRFTFVPDRYCDDGFRLHLKGLSCFLSISGSRPSLGVDLRESTEITLVSTKRQEIGTVFVLFGVRVGEARHFHRKDITYVVPLDIADQAVMIEGSRGSSRMLLYQPAE